MSSGKKYLRDIPKNNEGLSDVYDVLRAFNVTDPAVAHAVKKLLCTGLRGHKGYSEDIQESIDALNRAVPEKDRKYSLSLNQLNSDLGFKAKASEGISERVSTVYPVWPYHLADMRY